MFSVNKFPNYGICIANRLNRCCNPGDHEGCFHDVKFPILCICIKCNIHTYLVFAGAFKPFTVGQGSVNCKVKEILDETNFYT